MLSTLTTYLAAIMIHSSKEKYMKKLYLISSLVVNLALLFTFKYFNFFTGSISNLLNSFAIQLHPITLKVLLPVGISFYTFQALGYSIDVYRGDLKPEKHLGIYALFVSFFPQLVAGPIERAKHLLPQFLEKHKFNYEMFTSGLKLMLFGFFKKVVIADRIAAAVDFAFADVHLFSQGLGGYFFLLILMFGIQIYCDFSGYTDIARGAARMMGFSLMENFRRPYYAKSVSEFWRRWHISLSTWFRDYVYIPLGGNRVKKSRWVYNISVVFLVTGLWHGANWTFVIWGALHGIYLIISKFTEGIRTSIAKLIGLAKLPKVHGLIKIAFTFLLVNLTWIFFRAGSLSDAMFILSKIFSSDWSFKSLSLISMRWPILIISLLVLSFIHLREEFPKFDERQKRLPYFIRAAAIVLLIVFMLLFGVFGSNQFIYFQF